MRTKVISGQITKSSKFCRNLESAKIGKFCSSAQNAALPQELQYIHISIQKDVVKTMLTITDFTNKTTV